MPTVQIWVWTSVNMAVFVPSPGHGEMLGVAIGRVWLTLHVCLLTDPSLVEPLIFWASWYGHRLV